MSKQRQANEALVKQIRASQQQSRPVSFEHVSTYCGASRYTVYGDGQPYRIEHQFMADPYKEAQFNGTEEQYGREVVGAVGFVHGAADGQECIKPAIVMAFNAWRKANHSPHPDARGGRYVRGQGWVEIDT